MTDAGRLSSVLRRHRPPSNNPPNINISALIAVVVYICVYLLLHGALNIIIRHISTLVYPLIENSSKVSVINPGK